MKFQFLRVLLSGLVAGATWHAQGAVANHLVLSEIGKNAAANSEYTEIYNPTTSTVNLENYWVTDYRSYANIVTDADGIINVGTTDNLLRFPPGTALLSGQVVIITARADTFLTQNFGGSLANFTGQAGSPLLFECTETNASVPNMVSKNGSTGGAGVWNLTDNDEFVALFWWDGVANLMKDVDIVMWGVPTAGATSSNAPLMKTTTAPAGKAGAFYQNDNGSITILGVGNGGHLYRTSIIEDGEASTGGNGLDGHDETTEIGANSWTLVDYTTFSTPGSATSPGTTLLPIYTGNVAPLITNVDRSVENPGSASSVVLSADIKDVDGTVASVKFYVDSGLGFVAAPASASGETFTATVGPFADNTLVKYYVEATDNNGAVKLSPPGAPGDYRQFYVDDTPIVSGDLVINEVLYDAIGSDTDSYEWVEIHNTRSTPLDLSYVQFADDTNVWFAFPNGTTIPGKGYVILSLNEAAFNAEYSTHLPAGLQVFDWGSFALNNTNPEKLRLRHINGIDFDNADHYLDFVPHDDMAPWPELNSNSTGRSMELINPLLDNELPGSWAANAKMNPPLSTPGTANSVLAGVYVTEVDRPVEFPAASAPVTITAKITAVVPGTTVASGKIYFSTNDGSSYSSVNMTATVTPDVWTGNIPGQPAGTHVRYYVEGTSNLGETGRYPVIAPELFEMYIAGAAQPQAGSIVINEILYDNISTDAYEYVELFNTTNSPIDIGEYVLTDSGNVPFSLPASTTIPAKGFAILTMNSFNFFTAYAVPAGVNYYGWEDTFNLSNVSTETLKFMHPNQYKLDGTGNALSQVSYSQLAPWPTWDGAPSGGTAQPDSPNQRGRSIELINPYSADRETGGLWGWTTRTESPGFMGSPGAQNSIFSTSNVHDWELY